MADDDSSTDLVALTGNVGTWMAVLLGLGALVGVVGPYLALRASVSDTNRAMNAVKDDAAKYVGRGFKITRTLRIGRRIRVPNLGPSYITNQPDDTTMLMAMAPHASSRLWALSRVPEYQRWNSGWAKVAELIGAYRFSDPTAPAIQTPLPIDPSGGSLEVVNSRTALVAHKQWIMLIGLLGRYGKRPDAGILQKGGIRRDFGGEVAGLSSFAPPVQRDRRDQEDKFNFEWVRKKSRSSGRERRSRARRHHADHDHHRRLAGSSSDSDSFDMDHLDTSSDSSSSASSIGDTLQRNRWGAWTVRRPGGRLDGITGSFARLGRQMGTFSYLTCVSFVPHTARQMFGPGTAKKEEVASLQTLLWLAHGFLPNHSPVEDGSGQEIICIESPPASNTYFSPNPSAINFSFFSLQQTESDSEIPISIGNCIRCLGIPPPRVEQFLPTASPSAAVLEQLRTAVEDFTGGHSGLQISHGWIRMFDQGSRREEFHRWFPLKDMEKTVTAFLRLDWDPWGYLVWRGDCDFWRVLLNHMTSILRTGDALDRLERFFADCEVPMSEDARKGLLWRVGNVFLPDKSRQLHATSEYLKGMLDTTEAQPLRVPLAALFCLDSSFRSAVAVLAMMLTEPKQASAEEEGQPSPEREEDASEKHDTAPPVVEGFTYSYDTKELRRNAGVWKVSEDLSRAPEADTVVEISAREMVAVGLWAAHHAAIWLSSQDSRPLISFVGKLDQHVYVL